MNQINLMKIQKATGIYEIREDGVEVKKQESSSSRGGLGPRHKFHETERQLSTALDVA